ncbi:MAG: RNA polymerase sigma factor [Pyrinomonadaceae bacterium]
MIANGHSAREATGTTDEGLVALALKDDRYFEILVERYEEKLQRYIMRFINCRAEDAEDIVQEAFINAYRNLNGFDTRLKFSSWLYRIAHNEAVSHIRRVSSRPVVTTENEEFEMLASELDMEKDLGKKMNDAKLHQAIAMLGQKYRDVIVLRYLEEKTYEEISDILRKPLGSVASLITRAKRLLLKHIQEEGRIMSSL